MLEINNYQGVVQIRMSRVMDGKPLYWVAAYLIDGLLIDTGCRHTAEELAQYLEGRQLKFAVNTHYHEDHVGGNSILQQKYGLSIFAHQAAVDLISQVPELYPYQELVWGCPEPTVVDCIPQTISTEHHQFQVIETPGHCPGHIALFERKKGWCFTGDLFVGEKPKIIRREENIWEIIASMNRLRQLETEQLILFTSLGTIIEDGKNALAGCVQYLQDLGGKAAALREQGLAEDDIVQELFGGENQFFLQFTNGQFSSMNLIRSLLNR
ncbi:MAG: MBL fold metallo-hydrolase [Syntrophomonadaceae bacterium]|nr:MBL fold metallo-hydrolase [Syntrophomonadaceae bacterium]